MAGRDAGPPRDAEVIDAAIGPDSDLDPTVSFVWTQTLPGPGICGPGRYTGSFTCSVQRNGMDVPIGGQLRFDLEGASEGALSITNGSLGDLTGAIFTAGLEGSLDCVSRTLGASTVNGMAVGLGAVFPTFRTFEATLDGELDESTLTLVGTFTMTNDAGEVCRGAFEAGAAP